MKKILPLLILFVTLNLSSKGQYVTIPDANFASWLTSNFPSCMNGNQMDTTCNDIVTIEILDVFYQGVGDLDGIQYFDNLKEFYCEDNITTISALPRNLKVFHLEQSEVTQLPDLPTGLEELIVTFNNLSSLPSLPNSLRTLFCGHNQIVGNVILSDSLRYFDCSINQVTSFTGYPRVLKNFFCRNNNLTNLPILSDSLLWLDCSGNQLVNLPELPDSLRILDCSDNNIICFPNLPLGLEIGLVSTGLPSSQIDGNPFSCLPNYTARMGGYLLQYPLCVIGDISNPSNCPSADGIVGRVFSDNDSNCQLSVGDSLNQNVRLKLFDSIGNFVAQTNSFYNGIYNFSVGQGNYQIVMDTTNKPYTYDCTYPGIDTSLSLTTINPLVENVDFSVRCKTGVDYGIQSIVRSGTVFPGIVHALKINAGDLSHWYNMNCGAGQSGILTITIVGDVTYQGSAVGALVPNVSGNILQYTIADYASINNLNDFNFHLLTNTSAQAGDTICISANLTLASNDINQSNNSYNFCYIVGNSYDPNIKEVYPINVAPEYSDWFTYTIHFQNTGNAAAQNIRLVDSLDSNLDYETFEVINYSHPNNTTLQNGIVSFRFPNIMLPDSTSSPQGSIGFIQYRIKPKPLLPQGTSVLNRAYIYFDYNAPIITNTTTNLFAAPLTISSKNQQLLSMRIFPNPSSGLFTIKGKGVKSIEVNNLLGINVQTKKVKGDIVEIDLTNMSNGIYMLKIETEFGVRTELILKN